MTFDDVQWVFVVEGEEYVRIINGAEVLVTSPDDGIVVFGRFIALEDINEAYTKTLRRPKLAKVNG